jgi:hypothetical protein
MNHILATFRSSLVVQSYERLLSVLTNEKTGFGTIKAIFFNKKKDFLNIKIKPNGSTQDFYKVVSLISFW